MYITHSQFNTLMADEFGKTHADSLKTDFVLTECGFLTIGDALNAGYKPSEVWDSVCDAFEIPPERRLGKLPKKKDTPQKY
ncbi:MAG: DUF3046 domain-containing protein [Micrococcaceae bacterium]